MTRRRSAWVHGAEVIAALALVAVVAVVVVRVKPGKTSDQSTATTVATSSVPSGGNRLRFRQALRPRPIYPSWSRRRPRP